LEFGRKVIPLLQAHGLNVNSVQNPLVDAGGGSRSYRKVIDREDGPTVLAGHSFSGMILTKAGAR